MASARQPLQGQIRPASDKSISHRALMLAALADGESRIDHLLNAGDVQSTAEVLRQLSVPIRIDGAAATVTGVGLHGLKPPSGALDFGNSGTAIRLMTGILSAQPFASQLIGDQSLSSRPMARILTPLTAMGADIRATDRGTLPLQIQPVASLEGIDYLMPVASAQVKSCLLLAGLYAQGRTRVREPRPTRDYTERMLHNAGCEIQHEDGWIGIRPVSGLRACSVEVPADPSAAAFFMLAATLIEGSHVRLQAVGMNPTRTGLIRILRAMGAQISEHDPRLCGSEQVADLEIRHAPLRGIDVPEAWVPDGIDEFPALFVAAACAQGVTRIRGAAELRVKESDRIAVMARALTRMGIKVTEHPDGADIIGGTLHSASVDAADDHRCAMSLLIAALRIEGGLEVAACANIGTSYPDFFRDLQTLGGPVCSATRERSTS